MTYTKEEKEVFELLGKAWNKYVSLPVLHPDHQTEFRYSLHECQRLLMARLAIRTDPEMHPQKFFEKMTPNS